MDMPPIDITLIVMHKHNYHVDSNGDYMNYYFVIRNRNTTQYFILCRITQDIHKPRVKM